MSDMQDPLERAHDAALAAETAKRKAEQAYEQAIVEGTWEYSFQTWYADGWETTRSKITRDEEWWTDKSIAEGVADRAYDPYRNRPIRMIRRRVSPPEVINE